jgi:hypothetical protein
VKFESYQSTPGLDRIPPAERYSTYRATHQQLLRADAHYRRRYHQYLGAVLIVAAVPCTIWLGSSVLGIIAAILLSLIPVAGIVFLAFQQQRHMNRCIGRVLQSQAR